MKSGKDDKRQPAYRYKSPTYFTVQQRKLKLNIPFLTRLTNLQFHVALLSPAWQTRQHK